MVQQHEVAHLVDAQLQPPAVPARELSPQLEGPEEPQLGQLVDQHQPTFVYRDYQVEHGLSADYDHFRVVAEEGLDGLEPVIEHLDDLNLRPQPVEHVVAHHLQAARVEQVLPLDSLLLIGTGRPRGQTDPPVEVDGGEAAVPLAVELPGPLEVGVQSWDGRLPEGDLLVSPEDEPGLVEFEPPGHLPARSGNKDALVDVDVFPDVPPGVFLAEDVFRDLSELADGYLGSLGLHLRLVETEDVVLVALVVVEVVVLLRRLVGGLVAEHQVDPAMQLLAYLRTLEDLAHLEDELFGRPGPGGQHH